MGWTVSGHKELDLGNSALFLKDDLSVASNASTERCGQSQGLIEGVGVQRLRATKHRSHGLNDCPHYVVVGVLKPAKSKTKQAIRYYVYKLYYFLILRKHLC